jgi:hypothetical protein
MSYSIAKWFGRWPVCLLFGVIATVMFTYFVPRGVADITQNGALAPRILDEYYLTWTARDAQNLFQALGPAGRLAYQNFYLHLDFWFPVLTLAIFYSGLLSLAFPQGKRWAWLNIVPLVMYFCDMAENINHYSMAGSFPNLLPIQLQVGPLLSLSKYVFITGLPILALLGFIQQYWHRSLTKEKE